MTVLVYLGPSLELDAAKSILPDAIYLPPIRHADLVSDIPRYNPTHVIIIDGVFGATLPVWHKEIIFALLKGIKVYGCSSMGAIRASELHDFGMIGVGKIFEWYYEGAIEADDEVACLYHQTPAGEYVYDTWPLVNIRAGCLDSDQDGPWEENDELIATMEHIHWTQRSPDKWGDTTFDGQYDQKALDAIEALQTFATLQNDNIAKLDTDFVTPLFVAMMERDKRVDINGVTIPLQHIDSFIMLHSPDHHQIRWDAQNRALVMVLADLLGVAVSRAEVEEEAGRFFVRNGLETLDMYLDWTSANAMSKADFDTLTIQNARIRKLQKALVTTMMFRRQTRVILDYMRTHNQLKFWLGDCADTERYVIDNETRDRLTIDPDIPLLELLDQHLKEAAITIDSDIRTFTRETGIGTLEELNVCLSRFAFSRSNRARI